LQRNSFEKARHFSDELGKTMAHSPVMRKGLDIGRIAGISLVAYACFLLVVFSPAVELLELKVLDSLQILRLERNGPQFSSSIAVISVDDESVDPIASPLSDVWGRGGWLTRDLWVQQMQFHTEFFRPRVLAYDILFLSSEKKQVSQEAEALSRLQTMESLADRRKKIVELETSGNDEIENQIYNMKEIRESGGKAPFPVFAYYFPTGRRTGVREEEGDGSSELRKRALPEGVVISGKAPDHHQNVLLPIPGILHSEVGLGAINVTPDRGGVVRRVPLVFACKGSQGQVFYVPSFALETYFRAMGIQPHTLKPLGRGYPGISVEPGRRLVLETEKERLQVPIDDQMRLFLNNTFRFTAGPSNRSYVRVSQAGLVLASQKLGVTLGAYSEAEVAEARETAGLLMDRVVFVAQAWTGSGDIGSFPLEENTPNVMAHMLAVDNLLRRDFLHPPSRWVSMGVGAVISAVAVFAFMAFGPGKASALLVGGALLYPLVAYGALAGFGRGLHVLTPTALMVVLFGAHAFHQFLHEARRRREVRKLFSSMVSPRVLELMEQQPESVIMEGRRMDATMFFSDVAGFTSISEKLTPQELSSLLNRYLTPMSDIILASDGYVDKYQGDGIMAVWGVPYADPEHAVKACRAARDQLKVLRDLVREIESECGVRIDVRIGINSGMVSAGNMGSARKFQYTVMGDAVNLAARLEPANKDYGSRCIIGSPTRDAVRSASDLVLRRLDRIVVKGKTEPVEIYELCELDQPGPWIAQHEAALADLWDRRWDEAEAGFRAVLQSRPGDGAAQLMLQRLEVYRQTPPPPGWKGAWVRASKD
jgi:adenylate cyclase